MCGIYGATFNNEKLVAKLINESSHRGPDGSGVWSDTEITLGHNLLSITDEPRVSRQPWMTPKGNVLVFNGELFNYKILRSFAIRHDYNPKTFCDTEILAWCLDSFGVEYTNKNLLDSMHAYAYYNTSKRRLYLSRDHAGIKPIYFIHDSGSLVFSSEIGSLLGVLSSSPGIDQFALSCFLHTSHHLTRSTVFKGISKVMPGETLKYCLNKKSLTFHSRDVISPISCSNAFDAEEFRCAIKEATLWTSSSDKKTALLLSGGLDSSVIALNIPRQVKAYSTKYFPNTKEKCSSSGIVEDYSEDCVLAHRLACDLGLSFSSLEITPEHIVGSWPHSIKAIEEPSYMVGDPVYFETFSRLKSNNVLIVLTGDFGDELFGGYNHHAYWKYREDKISTRPMLIKKWLKSLTGRIRPVGFCPNHSIDDLYEYISSEIPDDFWNEDDPMNSWLALDCFYVATNNFMSRNDKFGMRFSMESRFPMAVKAFMKYCFSIHSDRKILGKGLPSKSLLRNAFKDDLPKYILDKPKTGWSSPIVSWYAGHSQFANIRDSMAIDGSKVWKALYNLNPRGTKNGVSLAMLNQWFLSYGYKI